MATFIEASRCKGARPHGIVGHRFTSRPDLIGKLLHDRAVARFIVAPTGYGKSTVAFEYANLIFAFKHVFWIRCSSPCFLRDLDAGTLLASLRKADPGARLVICDDVPPLDDGRAAAFDAFAEGVLAADCELIATCSPAADTFSHLQRDRMLLGGSDLLLADDELTLSAMGNGSDAEAMRRLPEPQRAACLVWHDEGVRMLLTGAVHEEVPADIALAMVSLLALGDGVADDLAAFMGESRASEAWDHLAERYPYLGMDVRAGVYACVPVTIPQLAETFSSKMPELASASLHGDRDGLASALADALLHRGRGARAAELMARFAAKGAAAAWLIRSCRCLTRRGEAASIEALHGVVRVRSGASPDQLSLCVCWACLLLGDTAGVSTFAGRVMRSSTASAEQKMAACALIAMHGGEEAAVNAMRKLEQLAEGATAVGASADPLCTGAALAADMVLAAAQGWSQTAAVWDAAFADMRMTEEGRDALLFCGAWLLEHVTPDAIAWEAAESGRDARGDATAHLMRLGAFCKEQAEQDAAAGAEDWFSAHATAALEGACASWALFEPFRPSGAAIAAAQRMGMRLAAQREARAAEGRPEPSPAQEHRVRSEGSSTAVPATTVPMLSVNLFGGMEVRIGGKLVAPSFLRRMKVKTLLALLVTNRGRELSRDSLANMLWPESATTSYRNNFYSIWSQLKRSLSLEGSCPYLVRTQTGCSLDARLVTSDVYEYEQVCRALLFGSDASEDWEGLYARVCNDYAGKLMPCETENKTIAALRDHYHAQMVDGLIAATNRLVAMSEPQGAVWFAREAARRENKREDVYIALMEAQIAADQRSAALETYFSCRRYLNEELGIDPSMKLVELYRSIIEAEDVLTV